jgi:hypothetical protein
VSYYGRPILKEPVWKPEIPIYMFCGGLAGASSVLSFVARLTGRQRLARASLFAAAAAEAVSPALLISDLGRPERALNMLRVFKVTSPMSVGSWILAASNSSTMTAAACEALGIAPRLRRVAGVGSVLMGPPLSVYTATLLSDTAVPVWHQARHELPYLFAAESAASAGAAATLLLSPADARPARRMAVFGVIAAEQLMHTMKQRLGVVGEVYDEGDGGRYDRAARKAGVAGASLLALAGRRQALAKVGAALVLSGSLARRWSIFRAGFQSARDPRYTVEPQRERLASRSSTRSAPA